MAPPRATILIPSYNHGAFVLDAVRSALAQTERDIEVLVIDDGSTDDSVARLRTLSDPRLVVHVQENVGLSRTLNRGLARARAPWVKFLPSDDVLVPHAIERQLAAVRPGVGLVLSLPEVVDAGLAPLADPAPQAWFDHPFRDRAALLRGLLERNFLCAPGALFDRRLALAVGGFDETLVVAQDYDLWLKLLERSEAAFVAERLVRVRWHGANQSAVVTPASEAERAKVVSGTLARLGIAAWVELFRAALPPGEATEEAARRALAAALLRSNLPALREEAERLTGGEAAHPARPASGPRAPLEALAAAWRRLRDRLVPGERRRAPSIPPGIRTEHWLVIEPAHPAAGHEDDAARLAAALGAEGASATLVARRSPAAPPGGTARAIPFALRDLRALLDAHDERLRLVALAADDDVVALGREARLRGARLLYDKTAPALPAAPALAATELALVEAADDLIGATRPIVKSLAASRRLVHLLPVDDPAQWRAHAASLRSIVERPTVMVVVRCRNEDTVDDVRGCLDALVAARAGLPYRLTAVADGVGPEVERELDEREEAATLAVLRSPRRGFAACVNLALRATGSEMIVLLDAGWRVPGPGWLEPGIARLCGVRTLGAVLAGNASGGARAWLAPRAVLARAGGADEAYLADIVADLDLEQRLSSLGYAIAGWPAPAPASRAGRAPAMFERADERRFRHRWRRPPGAGKV